jgi:hypothetical protein
MLLIMKCPFLSNGLNYLITKDEKDGRISYWLQTRDYEQFRDNWHILSSQFQNFMKSARAYLS